MALPQYLVDAPSHFNWDIDTGTSKEFKTLIQQLEEHLKYNPTAMRIQAMLLLSFLYVSKYKHPKPDITKGRIYLKEALEEINQHDNKEEKIGYKIVAKCNDAYMDHILGTSTSKLEIENLLATATDLSRACIHSVRAFALSRVGLNKYEQAKLYFKRALEVQPENTQWLFGLALVTGRSAHNKDSVGKSRDEKEERELYEKILKIDENHALAHAFLADNLVEFQQDEVTMHHAYKARKLAPTHPHILTRAGRVLRKAKQYRYALTVLKEACEVGNTSLLFHQIGLVYQDMYNEQQAKKKEAIEWCQEPDKNQAICYFTMALEANPSNIMALLDRGKQYEQLRHFEKAKNDFESAISTINIHPADKVIAKSQFGLFLERSLNNREMASEQFKAAIECAIEHCIQCPISDENPKPNFDYAILEDLETAKDGYTSIMAQKIESSETSKRSEGLRGMAWFYQVLGEHDAAREKYIEYLKYDGKSDDNDAIYQLTKCLIQLEDFEEARNKIQDLRNLNKTEDAQKCLIECALLEGKNALQQNQVTLAKDLFTEAVDDGSMEGCHKLTDILKKDPDVLSLNFRTVCAKILNCCKLNDASNDPLDKEIRILMDLKHTEYGNLRNKHLTLEQILLENQISPITREILEIAAEVIYQSRIMLDRIMISFRQKHYPSISGSCMYFHIQQDYPNQPKTAQQVKTEVLKKLIKPYKWDQFDTKFPDLCDFLVEFQPAYPGNTDNWYIALQKLGNRDKHTEKICYSHYHIPTILNGCKGILSIIPEGQPIYGNPCAPENQEAGITYELFGVIEVARKAAIEVERIVAEFHKNM